MVTSAGRCHDMQPFTYTPDPGLYTCEVFCIRPLIENRNRFINRSFDLFVVIDVSVKKETGPPGKPCSLEQIKGKRECFTVISLI